MGKSNVSYFFSDSPGTAGSNCLTLFSYPHRLVDELFRQLKPIVNAVRVDNDNNFNM